MAKKSYSEWSKEQLIEELSKLKKRKKYGLVWEDQEEDVVNQCKTELPVLEEISNKEINTDSEQPTNVLIEGDNFHALSVLNYTHNGKIDVIYIDPPYNTGAKDWKYNNNYVDKNDRWRHSKFIMMLYRRIKIAKNLLSPDGVIMVAIDDHEIHNVRHLLDECFGEQNYISTICVEVNPAGQNIRQNSPAISHDYFLIYAKSIDKAKLITRSLTEEERSKYKYEDENGCYLWDNLRRRGGNSTPKDRPGQWFPLYVDYKTKRIDLKHFEGSEEVFPIDPKGIKRIWRVNPKGFEREYAKGNISIVKKSDRYEISKKSYEPQGKKPKTIWKDPRYSATSHGTKLLIQILGVNTFTYPKSLYLVEDCLRYYAKPDATVLDFFAGSGTTGQAVLELNKKDGGKRNFILCTNNEIGEKDEVNFRKEYNIGKDEMNDWKNKNRKEWLDWCEKYGICTSVTYPRINNVIKGYRFSGSEKTVLYESKISEKTLRDADLILEELEMIKEDKESIYDEIKTEVEENYIRLIGIKKIEGNREGIKANLRYYKTKFVKDALTDHGKRNLVNYSTEMLCLKEECFDLVKSEKHYKIYKNHNGKHMGIVYDDEGIENFKKEVSEMGKHVNTYVFSLDDSAREEEFEDMVDLVDLKPIPEVILNVYRRIFK